MPKVLGRGPRIDADAYSEGKIVGLHDELLWEAPAVRTIDRSEP